LKGDAVARVTATVHPLAIQLAGKPQPQTPLEGKFSLAFCIALGLRGNMASAADFSDERLQDSDIRQIVDRVELKADASLRETAARMSVTSQNGRKHDAEVTFALGNPENPMQWPDMKAKFIALTEPHLDSSAEELFAHLRTIEHTSDLAALAHFCAAGGGTAKAAE
jgi:2-methylcitrate dehydratase PrpD